jgi:xylulose-5-phosphate/fructose-6-phosphate phosphoketolase
MTLSRPKDHPNGMSAELFRDLFTDTQDVVFSFHGYPGAIHQLVHGRPDADRFHCRGFIEQGTTTTPFDMVVRNRTSRYDLVIDAIHNTKRHVRGAGEVKAWCEAQLRRHESYIVEHLQDMPEVRDWMVEQATDTPQEDLQEA